MEGPSIYLNSYSAVGKHTIIQKGTPVNEEDTAVPIIKCLLREVYYVKPLEELGLNVAKLKTDEAAITLMESIMLVI